MNMDATLERARVETTPFESGVVPQRESMLHFPWSRIIVCAFTATAVSSIMVSFGASLGLGISSSAPTWRDASMALWVLSGLFLILQALISFGCGGYLTARTSVAVAGYDHDEVERNDGLHGIAAWAVAVVLGAFLAAAIPITAKRPSAL